MVTDTLAPSGVRAFLRTALGGDHQADYTTMPLGRAVALLAVPMVLEMAMESLFGVVDVAFVSRLGADSLAVVAVTEALLTILFGAAMGVGMAATAMVARRTGEGDRDGAANAAVQTVWIGVGLSLLVAYVGVAHAPALMGAMGAAPEVVRLGSTYGRVMIGGAGCIVFLFLLNAVFRGVGDAVMAMRVLWLANLVNLVLDPCLIFGLGPFPALGVNGAAVATTIGRSIGALYAFWHLVGGGRRLTIPRTAWRLDPPVLRQLARLSTTGAAQFLLATASWVGLVTILARFGTDALGGYTLAIRIVLFTILPSWGLGSAAATLVGQNLGAGRPDRAEQAVWRAGFYNMCFLGVVSVVFVFFPQVLIDRFTDDPAVRRVAIDCLRFLGLDYLLFAYGLVVVQAFNGAGDTRTPTLINLFCYWAFQIPVAYALAVRGGWGPRGVFVAIMLTEALVAIVGIAVFRRGAWKRVQV